MWSKFKFLDLAQKRKPVKVQEDFARNKSGFEMDMNLARAQSRK